MIKTVFEKIMLLFLVVITISMFVSGIMTSQMMRDAHLSESATQLESSAENLVTWVQFYNRYPNVVAKEQLRNQIALEAVAGRSIIWMVDEEDNIFRVDGSEDEQHTHSLTEEEIVNYYFNMLPDLKEGKVVKTMETDSDLLKTPVITVGVPVLNEDGEYTQFLFAHRRIDALNDSLTAIYRQIVLSIAISMALGIVLTYILTKSMIRPLTILTKGVKQLARGRFDIWLSVKSKDEIGQLAETFNTVAQDLQKNEKTRESFVANVSHELRSPLTSMQGLVQGVIDGTIPQEEHIHYLGVVLDETRRLNVLINDLLDLSKLESGQFPLEINKIDINEMIRRTLIVFESKIDVKNLMVEIDFEKDKEFVMADANRITQVVNNLVDNAIKFADYGGRLRIGTHCYDKSVFISVNNSGEPINRESIPYLFERFYKADKSHTRVKEGTGIGLSIVKKILEEHRQKVWVESDRIGGTTFTFTLKKAE